MSSPSKTEQTQLSADREDALRMTTVIGATTTRIAKIVTGLRFFAQDGKRSNIEKYPVSKLIEDTLGFCRERFANHGVQLDVVKSSDFASLSIECRSVEISQVLLNLLNNSFDAIEPLQDKWVKIEVQDQGDTIALHVTDCGAGIPKEVQEKMMEPFYTTKAIGKGTGLGMSISKGVIESHGGKIFVDNNCANTKITLVLPKSQPKK